MTLTIFRIASITKPIAAAAVIVLVEDGRMALDDPVGRWLPELASPTVVRTPAGPVHDVVPAVRPITVVDLLTSRAGYGFPSEFSLPAVQLLFQVQKDGRAPQLFPALARIPLLYQPGEAWLYGTSFDILGVLIAQVWGRPLPEFLAERLFAPLGMVDTGFVVPAGELHRFPSYYSTTAAGGLELADPDRADARLLAIRRPGMTPSVVPDRAHRHVDPRVPATTYFRSWQDGDFATLRSTLADDVTFRFGLRPAVEAR